jgi:DNA-directed RNA polymerase subunit RPC12/RpoP
MAKPTTGRLVGELSPPDPWRKCWRCGVEYMGLSACPDCTTENAAQPEQAAGHESAHEEQPARCGRCGIRLLPNEHTRERGICHSGWADDMAQQAAGQEPVPDARLELLRPLISLLLPVK